LVGRCRIDLGGDGELHHPKSKELIIMNTTTITPNWASRTTCQHRHLAHLMFSLLPSSRTEHGADEGIAVYRALVSAEERSEYRGRGRDVREALALVRELGGIWSGPGSSLYDTSYALSFPLQQEEFKASTWMRICQWHTLDEVQAILEDVPVPAYA
jgi:hypothetical protein